MIEQIEYRGFNINTYQDEDPFNPRTDYDQFGKIALIHSRYTEERIATRAFYNTVWAD